jgi:3-hydroxyacyl-[acyl-carrier-protein] dehydratase
MSEPKLHDKMATLIESGDGCYTVRLAEADHPVFLAHFEGNPILPGFMQLDIIADLAGKRIIEIKTAKFMMPVYPEDVLDYQVIDGEKMTRIIVRNAMQKNISDFKLVWK